MPGGSLVCRRCWYVVDDDLKQAYRAAREALKHSRTASNIELLVAAKKNILDSINPRGTSS